MSISRRDFVAIAACTLASAISTGKTPGPILWSVTRNQGKAYMFGFADAKDRSWLTPPIQRAFDESKEAWFETPHNSPEQPPRSGPSLADELGHDQQRSLFDVLGPRLAERTLAVAKDLDVPREQLEHLRPWLAFFVINNAFRKKFNVLVPGEIPDEVLANMAAARNKPIHSESPTNDDLLRVFANLSDQAQREHMEDLLDYIRDEKAGLHKLNDWIIGHPDNRFIERMRLQRPALYQAMHVQRNKAWAERISGFLSTGGVYFICVGLNHVLGPDSIIVCLRRIGLSPKRV